MRLCPTVAVCLAVAAVAAAAVSPAQAATSAAVLAPVNFSLNSDPAHPAGSNFLPVNGVLVGPGGTVQVLFPPGSDVATADVQVGAVTVGTAINQAARTVSFPAGLVDATWSIDGVTNSAIPVPGDTALHGTLDVDAAGESSVGVRAFFQHEATAFPITVTKGVPFTLTLPTTSDYTGFDGLSLTGASLTFGQSVPGVIAPGAPFTVLPGQLHPTVAGNGSAISLTVPTGLAATLPTASQAPDNLYLALTLRGFDHPQYDTAYILVRVILRDPPVVVVQRTYRDVLGREAEPAGLAGWADLLRAGASPALVANGITNSAEYRSRLIIAAYERYLGRVPAPSEVNDWLAVFAAGLTPQQLEIGFAASEEFFQAHGGTAASWVTALYAAVLDRPYAPAPAEVAGWLAVLPSAGRYGVAAGFVLSPEHLGNVIDALYLELLGRNLDPAGRAGFVGYLAGGGRLEQVVAGIIGSVEYRTRSLFLL